jgi:hypothetical protein
MILQLNRTISARPKRTGPAYFLLLALLLILPSTQAAERTIKVGRPNLYHPVAITLVSVGNLEVQCGLVHGVATPQPVIPFEADEDWLQNATISILNRTNKPIAFVGIGLYFPETGDGKRKPVATHVVSLGRIPQSVAFLANGRPLPQPQTAKPLSFFPGQTTVVPLRDHADAIKHLVGQFMQPSAVTKVEIRIQNVYFDDGMQWDGGGGFSVPDANQPGKRTRLEQGFFPGAPTWPPM